MENTAFAINILPVGVGDCIHLRFFSKQKWYNIIIDSGPREYAEQFWHLLSNIQAKNEQVDLLCFTHIDDDHIQAAAQVFGSRKGVGDIVQKIWINIPPHETEHAEQQEPETLDDISVDSALKLYRHILWFVNERKLVCETHIEAGDSLSFGDIGVTAVLPYSNRLKKFEAWWVNKRPFLGDLKDVSNTHSDQSETNGSSIVLLIEAFGKRLLFTGDAFAVDLWSMAKAPQCAGFDLVKLPHHGSRSNITRRMLNKLRCRHFIISADGTHSRPAQDTIDLLGKYGQTQKGVTVYGNYEWPEVSTPKGVKILTPKHHPESPMDHISIRTEAIP